MPYYVQVPPPPPQKPSGAYKALGIVMCVLGVGGIFWALFSMASLGFLATRSSAALYGSETLVFGFVRGFMSVVTGAMLAVAGFGIFRAKKWSRYLGIAYAALSLFDTLAGTLVNVLLIQPKTLAKMGTSPISESIEMISYVSAAFGLLVMSALPITVLVFLLRSRATQELDA